MTANSRFEGVYGGIYDRVIQNRRLRRAAFSLWGSADPLYDLDGFVADAVGSLGPGALIVDLPSGGGTLLPLLARHGYSGSVIEVDLAATMLERARVVHRSAAPGLEVSFMRADALHLPLEDASADLVVSINGLHVVRDHAAFLDQAARITRPGGGLWLITPVSGPSIRSRAILAAACRLGITPCRPPTLADLRRLLAESGFRELRSYGGESITGLACTRLARAYQ